MFQYTVRVYYEDTDAGGIVYHANYLKFMERCRCEWLDDLGYSVVQLQQDYNISFVVAEATLKFHAPAKLFDELTVSCEILQLGKIQMTAQQKIYNKSNSMLLCTANIKLAALQQHSPIPPMDLQQTSSKFVALPKGLVEAIQFENNEGSDGVR